MGYITLSIFIYQPSPATKKQLNLVFIASLLPKVKTEWGRLHSSRLTTTNKLTRLHYKKSIESLIMDLSVLDVCI